MYFVLTQPENIKGFASSVHLTSTTITFNNILTTTAETIPFKTISTSEIDGYIFSYAFFFKKVWLKLKALWAKIKSFFHK